MPLSKEDAAELIARRHPEWRENQLRWRWLLDSLEGGERYRQAVYGWDARNFPVRNLIRHKREYPDPRETPGANARTGASTTYPMGMPAAQVMASPLAQDQAQYATDDDYELRRARTPVPTFVAEAVGTYTSKIYGCEVDRDAPAGALYDRLREWWDDVDGRGTCVDEWMEQMVAPLVLACGQLDLIFDHPKAPEGARIISEADAAQAGVKRCFASHILPENMLWWKLDDADRYLECLVLEYAGGDGELAGTGSGSTAAQVVLKSRYRHWTAKGWTLYNDDGTVAGSGEHNFGRVPIVRVIDRRKPRCRNVGQPRFESIAERQREYYNRDSELILSDTIQAHPVLQGPDDYVQQDGTIPVGPGNLLPMKKNGSNSDATYQGFEYVDPPKGAAESLRQNKADIRNDVDRDAKLTKPAGSAGTNGTTVSQSGVSKQFDHDGLHSVLSQVAKMLAKVETRAAMMALTVLFDGKPPATAKDDVEISYPTVFNLYAADELAKITTDLQGLLSAAGEAPETETMLACEIVRKALPGRDDETYQLLDVEIAKAIQAKADRAAQMAEMAPPSPPLPGQDESTTNQDGETTDSIGEPAPTSDEGTQQ